MRRDLARRSPARLRRRNADQPLEGGVQLDRADIDGTAPSVA
ncbi:hypothetical protein CHKEEEPN_2148 [Methylorubrum podarium]|nr:hypothetical protein CHKEEEPN_2148 [Methylorubrum podarium]